MKTTNKAQLSPKKNLLVLMTYAKFITVSVLMTCLVHDKLFAYPNPTAISPRQSLLEILPFSQSPAKKNK